MPDFKKGGYVAAVAAMIEGSKYSLTLPGLEDWSNLMFYDGVMLITLI